MNLYNLYYIRIGISIGMGIVYIYITKYPPKINTILFYEIAHYGVKCYSFAQIASRKYIKNISQNKYIESSVFYLKDLFINDIELIKDSSVILRCKTSNLVMYNPLYMDFMIYSDIHSYPVNKIICKDVYSFVKQYEVCDFKLCMIKIILSEKENYMINLSTSEYNYYIVGNVVNKFVLLYLLYKQHRVTVNEDQICYTIEIMDHNINVVYITEQDYIIFEKSTYRIKNELKVREEREDASYITDYSKEKMTDHMCFNKDIVNEKSIDDIDWVKCIN